MFKNSVQVCLFCILQSSIVVHFNYFNIYNDFFYFIKKRYFGTFRQNCPNQKQQEIERFQKLIIEMYCDLTEKSTYEATREKVHIYKKLKKTT